MPVFGVSRNKTLRCTRASVCILRFPLEQGESFSDLTGVDNPNKGCLGSPMNNFMSSRKFGRPSRNFSVAFSMFIVLTIKIKNFNRDFLQLLVNYVTCELSNLSYFFV